MNSSLRECEKLEGKNILITGGLGFIGGHLANEIKESCNLTLTTHRKIEEGFNSVDKKEKIIELQLQNADVLNKILNNIDLVFHTAAEIPYPNTKTNPSDMYKANILGTLSLLEACRKNDVGIVYSSSMAVFGKPKYLPVDEQHPQDPTTYYGATKLGGEYYCSVYNELYGMDTRILRYSSVYGPGMDRRWVVSIFLMQAMEGKPLILHGKGESTGDFVFVDDVVQANLYAATKKEAMGEDFNIGSGIETSIRDLANQVINNTKSGTVTLNPSEKETIKRFIFDISKAEKELGYHPNFNLTDGIKQYFNSINEA